MKKGVVLILSALFAMLFFCLAIYYPKLQEGYGNSPAQSAAGEQERISATNFTVYDAEGVSVKLSDFAGKPTVVNFWATWCGYCVQELPAFDKLFQEYRNKINFVMLDLPDGMRETQNGALEYAEKQGFSFPIYFDTDGSAANAYSVTGIPMTLLVDQQGNLYQIHIGAMSEQTLREYLEALLEVRV